ncbi:MAG: GntR family transcriptional regulator [Deltaproteobacteria bacterium]|nr:MAG: GntR family transcriptional regulator [Deltaproteobacteria bacterium]
MPRIKKIRLCDSVIEAVKEMIAEEGFKPGDKFYSENELTKQLGVSRSSIREAVKILETTGFVCVRQGKGIFITDRQGLRFEEFTGWLKNNEQAIRDNFEVRMILESKVARYAAAKADTDDICRLQEAHTAFIKYARENDTERAIVCDGRFHRRLAAATKNETLHVLMKAITTKLPTGWISSLYTPGRMEKTINEHSDIVAAVKKGDAAGAENAMMRHLLNAVHDISCHIEAEQVKPEEGAG